MSQFRFAQGDWVHLLWGVLILAGVLVWLEFRSRAVLDRFVSRVMQTRLVVRHSLLRRLSAIACFVLAWMLLVFALMRPQWGMTVQQSLRVDAQIMVCLDVSKSMLAEDVAPSRLERAKIELDALLGLLGEGEQVGLIAFAGKATVLCPLTTDFGFLRLVLADAEPSSVGRGGTQIGAAIRLALDGFRDAGDVNRLLLLLTDGEDHESYPLEAAKAARDKGVKIVCIGFGDEAGSKIEVTDPQTGARSFLKDRTGQDVISRLDGATLREIATITDGAYVPAGTGALDLESIYRAHIATLLRGRSDTQQQVVRQEAYQWVVLAGLVALLLGLLLATPVRWQWAREARAGAALSGGTSQAAVWIAVALSAAATDVACAQPATPTPSSTAAKQVDPVRTAEVDDATDAAEPAAGTAAIPTDLPPREAYNRALALVRTEPEQAEQYLNLARRDAGRDGELRYRTLYNLGWVEVVRADAQLPDHPEAALPHLQQAANRFREAIRIRPDSTEARHNLEIISQRILELTDALAQRDPGDLARRLDAVIPQLRAHQAELQAVVEQAGEEVAPAQAESYRAEFRRLGGTQRPLIADVQRITESARQELDALQAKPADQKSPAEGLRSSQLTALLRFLDGGLQRLNQSRSLTRRLQGNRAFRRWSAGLSDVKRARDQLRNPIEALGQLLSDSAEVAALTRSLASANTLADSPSANQPSAPDAPDRSVAVPTPTAEPRAPVWLSREYLQEEQTAVRERTRELEQILAAVVASHGESADGSRPSNGATAPDPRQQQVLENIERALPPIRRAAECFERAEPALGSGALETAVAEQSEAVAALADAWECFFDIRRLIEVLYRDEQVLREACNHVPAEQAAAKEMAATMAQLQRKNRSRTTRLDTMLQTELEQAAAAADVASDPNAPAAPGTASLATPAVDEAERARLQHARELVATIATRLDESLVRLDELATSHETAPAAENATAAPERDARWTDAETATDEALRRLEELRRLFFSLVEHLRDTAQRQAKLNEQTAEQSTAPAADQTPERLGPLGHRQQELQQIAQALAATLTQQSAETESSASSVAPAPALAENDTPSPDAAEAAKKLAQAAELVNGAQEAMGTAAQRLNALAQTQPYDPAAAPFQAISPPQNAALEKLVAAIALLDPDQPPPAQNEAGKQEQQTDAAAPDQQQQDESQQQQNLTANQMLQLIRDHEAQRREDRKRRAMTSPDTVDKDW